MLANNSLLITLFLVSIAAVAWAWREAGRRTAARYRRALERLEAELDSGGVGDDDESPAEVRAIRQRLATGWMPVRGESSEVLSSLAGFLQTAVVKPLVQALHARGRAIRPRIQQALDAIEDIEFFAETPVLERNPADLGAALESVAREYGKAFKVDVKLELPGKPVSCAVDLDAVQDAFYLILANGGRHGAGEPLEVSLRNAGNEARITVRDAGEGFSEEALARATEPFFSTVPGALGLGLTHARHVVQAHGGTLALRNRDGGGEVEVTLPAEPGRGEGSPPS